MIVLADADQQRTACARADDATRLARGHRCDRVRAVELGDRLGHRGEQVAVVMRMDQMRDDLGVGLGDEYVSLLLQPCAQRLEVLDDPVVHDRDLAAADVRVRVGRGRRAVRRPARVRNAGVSGDVRRVRLRREIGDARGADQPVQAAVDDREPGRVVAPVLEPADALDQNRNDVIARDRADDAAHDAIPSVSSAGAGSPSWQSASSG